MKQNVVGDAMVSLVIVVTVLGIVGIAAWFLCSLKIIKPDEMAVLVILGEPISFQNSGLVFVPWLPGCFLKIFPKKLYNLPFPTGEVITKEGKYGKDNKEYGAVVIQVSAVMYFRFPQDETLIKTYESGIPTDDRMLMDFFEEVSVGSLRAVGGTMTWRETIENIGKITRKTESLIKKSKTFAETAINGDDMTWTIKEIQLPPDLERTLSQIDIQRIQAESARFEAEQMMTETIWTAVLGVAQSRGIPVEDVQEMINTDANMQKEFLELTKDLLIRRMGAKYGSYLDIRVSTGATRGRNRTEDGTGGFIDQLIERGTEAAIAIMAAKEKIPDGPRSEEKKPLSKVDKIIARTKKLKEEGKI